MAKKESVEKKFEKYNRKKVEADGFKFDSIAEREYYYKLKNEKLTGKIIDFELQPKFILQKKFKHRTEGNIREIAYVADFRVIPHNRDEYIIDVKGMATAKALVFRKMFLYHYPYFDLIWVVKNKKHGEEGWCEFFKLQKIRKEIRKKMTGEK